jgi:hypothetical protein
MNLEEETKYWECLKDFNNKDRVVSEENFDINNIEPQVHQNYDNNLIFNQFYQEKREWDADNDEYNVDENSANSISKKILTGEDNDEDQSQDEEIKQPNKKSAIECDASIDPISSSKWKQCFPDKFKELFFRNGDDCGFYMCALIIQKYTRNLLDMGSLKIILINSYNQLITAGYMDKIFDILRMEGKNAHLKTPNFPDKLEKFINSQDYYVTNLDLFVIITYFKIPAFLIATKGIILANKNKNILSIYSDADNYDTQEYIFIISPAIYSSGARPKYSLVYDDGETDLCLNSQSSIREIIGSAHRRSSNIRAKDYFVGDNVEILRIN